MIFLKTATNVFYEKEEIVVEKSSRFDMDSFVRQEYLCEENRMFVVGDHWNTETSQFEQVKLPVLLIEYWEAKQGVYVIDGNEYWCEYSSLD